MKKHSQKILRILAITSMLAIFTQATLVSASQHTANVNTTANVAAGTLTLAVSSSTSALKVGALGGGSTDVCSGTADPDVSLAVQTLCSNIGVITVADLRAYPVGWTLNTELKHLTYVNQVIKKLTSGTLSDISGVSPFDVDVGPYTGDNAHPNNKNSLYRFTITTAGGRAGSNPAGSFNMTRPDGTTLGVTAIPSDGDVEDGGLTFNFAAFAHVINDVYIVQVDAIHMFDRPVQGGGNVPAITATTKFRPTAVSAVGDSLTTNIVVGTDDNDVHNLGGSGGNQFTQSGILNIMSVPNNFGKGTYTISVGIETQLYANSTASTAFTSTIVLSLV